MWPIQSFKFWFIFVMYSGNTCYQSSTYFKCWLILLIKNDWPISTFILLKWEIIYSVYCGNENPCWQQHHSIFKYLFLIRFLFNVFYYKKQWPLSAFILTNFFPSSGVVFLSEGWWWLLQRLSVWCLSY